MSKASMKVGNSFQTNNYGWLTVVEYKDARNVVVRFEATGFVTVAHADSIRLGKVKDLILPSICGVGYIGDGKYKVSVNDRDTPEYTAWNNMLKRCYDKQYKEIKPTYADCSVCPEWHNYQNFCDWMKQQPYQESYHLDKDILYPGNKHYSPETCCVIPSKLNLLLTKRDKSRGRWPLGVVYAEKRGKFKAQINLAGKNKNLGLYSSPSEASAVYNEAKAKLIRDTAMQQVDNRIKRGLFLHAEIYAAGLADAPIELVKQKLGYVY